MRIAIVAPPWVAVPPPAYGGTEAVLDSLARGLSSCGHEVLLYTTGDSTCDVPKAWIYDEAVGVGRGGVASEFRHVIHAYDLIQEFDVVHDHTLVGPIYAERYPKLPIVTTNHGPFKSDLGDIYRIIAEKALLVAISHHQASLAQGTRIAAVIHHGVDPDRFPVGDGDGGYALFLGRMSPDKGAHIAAKVAKEAGIPLLIAAKMNEQAEFAYFETMVKPLLGDGVEYVGEVGGSVKYDLLARAACLLNPMTWSEPFGMVMIEAMACGTPVIATPRGAAPEILEEGVTGFMRSDETALVSVLSRVGELSRSACRLSVENHFSAQRMVDDHLVIYAQAIAEKTLVES